MRATLFLLRNSCHSSRYNGHLSKIHPFQSIFSSLILKMLSFTLAISWCALQEWNLFLPLLWKSCNQISLACKVRFPRDSLSLCWSPGWEAWHGAQNHHNSGRTSLVLLFSSLWVTLLAGMGFDFIMIAPLLPFHCGFFFVFGWGLSFLVGSTVLLSMVVQKLVAILGVLQAEMSTHHYTPPFWTHQYPLQYSCLENPVERGAWGSKDHRVTKSLTQLKWLNTHAHTMLW